MTTLVQSVSNLFETVGGALQALDGQLTLIQRNHEHIKSIITTVDAQQDLIQRLENKIESLENA